MMTPQQLERASGQFRAGYRACYRNAGIAANAAANPYANGTFAWHDWAEGFAAALAEIRAAAKKSA